MVSPDLISVVRRIFKGISSLFLPLWTSWVSIILEASFYVLVDGMYPVLASPFPVCRHTYFLEEQSLLSSAFSTVAMGWNGVHATMFYVHAGNSDVSLG